MHLTRLGVVSTVVAAVAAVVAVTALSASGGDRPAKKADRFVFFAADGMRQDLISKYLGRDSTLADFLKRGTSAAGGGLLTQAPPNTGAGWYSLATGAWPGVHGSTNNTFHVNGSPFTSSTSFSASGVMKAESIGQAAERGGLKVAQVDWTGGANESISGPTIDYVSFLSGRGVATNFKGHAGDALFDDPAFIASFGLQYDTPDTYPGAAPAPASGWTGVPASHSPAMEMHLRVIDFGTDKYGLDAYIFDSTNDGRVNYDKVLFARTKNATTDAVAVLRKGEWGDVKVTVQGGALNGKTAGFLVKVEELTPDLSRVRLFHTSVERANATWPDWPGEPGFTGDFAEYLAQTFPPATESDFAVLESGVVSEDTYAQQGLYWKQARLPMLEYVVGRYHPDLLLAGVPTTDEFSHQFLGLVTPKLPNGQPNPAYDDVAVDGSKDGRVEQRDGYLRAAYEEADEFLTKARSLMDGDPDTFVGSDHGFGAQFLAIDASKPLVDLGLLSKPQTANCRPATGELIGSAKACWAGGTLQVYLNVADRDPAGGGFTQIPAAQVDAKVAQIKAAYLALGDPNDWTGDGRPEGWKMIDRAFTKAEARYIPNGPNSTSDMASPTRTGDLVVFAYPPYQFDAETPGTLVALSHFFGQHGYVPDVQLPGANTNMRATFLAGGPDIAKGEVTARTIDLAPTLAFLMGVPEPQQSEGRVLTDVLKGGASYKPISIVGLNDFHGQLDPTTQASDNGLNVSVGGAPYLATMFDEELANLPGPGLLLAGGDNVGASPANSGLLQDMPSIDVENAWGLDATSYGNHEFDYGLTRLLAQQARANFPFLATNIVDAATGQAPDWVTPSVVLEVNGIKVGVIGAELQSTPDLVAAGNTAGLKFLDEATRIAAESKRLERQGVRVQVVVIHQGTSDGFNRIGTAPAVPWQGPILDIADALQGTTVDAMIVGHTHRVSNLMRGTILITEGFNAGITYSVLQLEVKGGDVAWAGGATRVAKDLGVAPRSDVKAIVDDANAKTAVLRNQVIGSQTGDIKRDLNRKSESSMGNLVADAMRARYPGVEAAWTNSGGLRNDLVVAPPSAGEQPGEITWGEVFSVLPFGNRTVILTLTGDRVKEAFENGFSAVCNSLINTGRFPQVSGLKVQFHCSGTSVVVDGIWKAPDGPSGTLTPLGPGDTLRFVTNDFMYTGGDGYTAFAAATNVGTPGDDLLQVAIDYITTHSPVTPPPVEGRIVGP